uniref:Uncharacterized protein n=1 Tax=viral metagenome TaxID=1070528 RepID=A0A6C0HZH6_9ZZZZ
MSSDDEDNGRRVRRRLSPEKASMKAEVHPEKVSMEAEEHAEPLRRTSSNAPDHVFVELSDNLELLQFEGISENILAEIIKRTQRCHDEFKKCGFSYKNDEQTACVGWSARALGITDDQSLCDSVKEQLQLKTGTSDKKFCDLLSEYVEQTTLPTQIQMRDVTIDELFASLQPNCSTPICISHSSIHLKHAILAIKIQEGSSTSCMLFDPSQRDKDLRTLITDHKTIKSMFRTETYSNFAETLKSSIQPRVHVFCRPLSPKLSKKRKSTKSPEKLKDHFGGKKSRKLRKLRKSRKLRRK